ncbi:MAG: protoporphyrinogen/coproporphyrinogen oxidase [Syntrophobacteraceae bacterium]
MKAIVIGGGPAGCAAAYTLKKNGHDVHLFEADDHVGGRTSQLKKDGFNLGTGALFLMGDIYPRTNAILKELGHYDELVPWRGLTHLVDWDKQRYTVGFDKVTSFLKLPTLTLGDKWHIIRKLAGLFLAPGPKKCFDGAELAKFDTGENLEQWSRRILGDRGHNYITVPYMGFLYAVPPSWLSTPLLHALFLHFYQMSLSVPPGGIGQVCDWMIEGTPGLNLHLSTPAEKVLRSDKGFTVIAKGEVYETDGVVVAPEPGVAADLLQDLVSPGSIKKLRECRYSEYAHVQVCYEKNPWPNFPVDIALPATELRNWGACVLGSRRQAGSVPKGGEVVGVYFYTPPLAHMSDEDIKNEALNAVTEVFGAAPKPSFVQLFHFKRGLSIADPGHYATLDSLHNEMPKGIYLAGDYFAHAGVEAAVLTGEKAALSLHDECR